MTNSLLAEKGKKNHEFDKENYMKTFKVYKIHKNVRIINLPKVESMFEESNCTAPLLVGLIAT